MGQASPKLVSWAAQDGRPEDLIYHLGKTGPEGLKAAPGVEKRRTPLILASIGGYTQCISVLYDAGANINEQDAEGFTALHHAACNGHLYAVQMLLDLGANPKMTTRFGIAPVHLATSSGHTPMLQLLASHNIDINVQESWGQTPLMIATQQSRLEAMKLLLKFGAETELHDRHHGYTALHVACTTKDEETVLVLLDGGANPRGITLKGLSVLGVAIENKFYRIVPLLMEYGACMNVIDYEIASGGLQLYLHEQLAVPTTLQRLSRVALRQYWGPSLIDEKLEFIPADIAEYIRSTRNDCCGGQDEVKKHALLGRTVATPGEKNEATTKF